MPLLFPAETKLPYSAIPALDQRRTKGLFALDNGSIDNARWRVQKKRRSSPPLRLRGLSSDKRKHLRTNGAGAPAHYAEAEKYKKSSVQSPLKDASSHLRAKDPTDIALGKLLRDSVQFVPASRLTVLDEMAILRSSRLLNNIVNPHRIRRCRIERLDASNWPKTGQRRQGFRNPGNFCYRRSAMQSLVHIPRLDKWLQHYTCHNPIEPSACLFCAIFALVKSLRNDHGDIDRRVLDFDRAARETARVNATGDTWPSSGAQDDAHHVLLFVVEQLYQRFNLPRRIIQSYFKLLTVGSWTCRDCNTISSNTSDDTGLSLGIGNSDKKDKIRGLEYYIKQHFDETLNGVRCETCGTTRDRTRKVLIEAAPEALFIQLKRFGVVNGRAVKNRKRVVIPRYLHLNQFMTSKSEQRGTVVYKLASVVSHAGTLNGGHYKCYAEDAKGWLWQYNDDVVTKASIREMTDPGNGFTPYILTYLCC